MMHIGISGASGLVGSSLKRFFIEKGFIVREIKREDFLNGDFEGLDIVIHLAGSNIATRWTKKVMLEIKESRIQTTENLVKRLYSLQHPPKIFISASGIGFYGNTKDQLTDENGALGSFFLSEVCHGWESASEILKGKGVRVIHGRFGVVLSSNGGMLKKILPLFRWGIGGALGSGNQYMSWIAIDDLVGAIYHIIQHPEIEGAVNVVSPFPVTNKLFTQLLCNQLGRKVGPSVPAFVLKMLFGKMAEEMLLSSSRIEPRKLSETGYVFKYPELSSALVKYLSLR